MPPPPPPSGGSPIRSRAKSGLVALRGRAIVLAPKAPENLFPSFFLCVGQSVRGWVPLELSPPPPPAVGVGQVLWVPAKSGCLPISFCSPPPPVAKKSLGPHPHPPLVLLPQARQTWQDQGLSGSLVLTTSANAVVAKKGSVAYDTSKAAVSHLVRELAIELAPLIRVNGVAPATVVQGSAMFPRDRVVGSLAKYQIPYTAEEPTAALVDKLAKFYAERTLTKSPITPADQAEAYFLLVSKRLSKTTGQVITVDGGLHEAFLR